MRTANPRFLLTAPPRVSYNYVVQMDEQKWYVVKEKVTGTC
jgi:hypothetical protein